MNYVREVQKQLDISITIQAGLESESLNTISDKISRNSNSLLFARACDNFQTYLVDVLTVIYSNFPHSIFKKKIDISELFGGDDLEVIRRRSVEKHVADLSYSKLSDLSIAVKKETGCALFESDLMLKRLNQMLNIRNVITHNRGFINKYSHSRLGHRRYVMESELVVYEAFRSLRYLFHCVKYIDRAVCLHFKLPHQELFESKPANA